MRRWLVVAMGGLLLVLAPLQPAVGGGPYDGEWSGAATASAGRCRPAVVTLTVEGRAVTGQVRFERDTSNINGTVNDDGRFGATIGFQPLTGQFSRDELVGSFRSFDCDWTIALRRAK
jgi:hypothetical protein